ncbi:hypothetical protein L0222_04390 [bacterium]|nr:hypothetical protein [bacterium]
MIVDVIFSADIVFIEQAKEKDILPYLNEECVDLMYLRVLSDESIEGNLCALALGRENTHERKTPAGIISGIADPSTMLPSFLDGKRTDLSVADALAFFPEWGLKEINKIVAQPYQYDLHRLIIRMLERN